MSRLASVYPQYTMPNVNWAGNFPSFTGTTFHPSAITQPAPPPPPQFPGSRLLIISATTGYDLPVIQIPSNGLAGVSSASNQHNATMSELLAWVLPQCLGGYDNHT